MLVPKQGSQNNRQAGGQANRLGSSDAQLANIAWLLSDEGACADYYACA